MDNVPNDDGNDDGDIPQLSSDTLGALQEFYRERDEQQKKFEELKQASEERSAATHLSMDMFTEDWNASQFWYSDETATTLAKLLLDEASGGTYIAVISAPSVYIQLKNLLNSPAYAEHTRPHVCLLEYDERFAVLEGFVKYDFRSPLKLPSEMKGRYDRIICDPPFLSTDCQTKAAITVRWLSKTDVPKEVGKPSTRVIVCTGERMESLIHKVYPGIITTTFEPQHAQGRLGNEFRCYANFQCKSWTLREEPKS